MVASPRNQIERTYLSPAFWPGLNRSGAKFVPAIAGTQGRYCQTKIVPRRCRSRHGYDAIARPATANCRGVHDVAGA